MKRYLLALPMLAVSVVAQAQDEVRNQTARSCEIFLDKVTLTSGSLGFRGAKFFIKTRNDKLNDEVVEVGYRHICTNSQGNYGEGCLREWRDAKMEPFLDASNYWQLELPIAGWNRGNNEYDGAFYVRTKKNTYYWAHAQNDGNFVFNLGTWNWLANLINYPNADTAATQHGGVFYVFNPQKCY